MYPRVRLLLAQVLAVVALSIVTQVWAETLYRFMHRGVLPGLPLWNILVATLMTLFVGRFSLKWPLWWRSITLVVLALSVALLLPAVGRGLPVSVSLFSLLVFAAAYAAIDIGRHDWGYSEARAYFAQLAVIFAVAIPFAHAGGMMAISNALLGLALASMLALDLAWDQYVEQVTKQRPMSGRTKFLLLSTALFLAATLLAGAGAFSVRPMLDYIAYIAREIFLVFLVPFGYMIYLILIVTRALAALLAGDPTARGEERMPEGLFEAVRDLDTGVPWLLQVFSIVFLVALVWLLLRRISRPASPVVTHPLDEHESLLGQIFSPRGTRKARAKPKRRLPLEPENIWQIFAYLELYGKAKSRPRAETETVAEYEEALRDILPSAEVRTITSSFEDVRYGERKLTSVQWQHTLAAWRKLKESTKA